MEWEMNLLLEGDGCRWQPFCDLTGSGDESHPLQSNAMYTIFVGGGVLDAPQWIYQTQ